jgi:hypothetical protein
LLDLAEIVFRGISAEVEHGDSLWGWLGARPLAKGATFALSARGQEA